MSLVDNLKTPTPWNWGTPANGVTMYNDTVKPLDDNIRLVASAVDNLPQPSEHVQANWNTSVSSDPSYIKNKPSIPSKTSDLDNDAGFITSSGIPSIPTKTSDLQNDSGFITEGDIPAQVNPDWNVDDVSDPRCILNKPESVDQVQADWNTSATSAASYIKNKPWVPEIDYTTRKVLMVGADDARPGWHFPLVVPKLACRNDMPPDSSDTFSFSTAGMDVSASPEKNFYDMFSPYSLVCGVFEIEKIKAKNSSSSSKLRLHPFPDDSISFYDNDVPCPIPMNSDWSQISYSGHEDGTGNYQVEKMLIPFTYYNDTSASKGLAVTFGSPGESDLYFEPQNITITCLSLTKTYVDNKDLYHRNNWNWGYNDFDPSTGH